MTTAVVTQFSTTHSLPKRIILGVVASLLFFITVMLREFLLVLVSARRGVPVKSITLFAIGGVLQIDKTGTSPSLESLLGTVGMLGNLIIAGIFFAVYQVLAHTGSIMVHIVVQWLAFICFMLTLFNIMPGLPLDGGRILRAILWKATSDYDRVTRITSWTGWGIGVAFAVIGIVLLITTQQWFVGILLALPGLVLQNAATHSRRQAGKQDLTGR
jgi:Zn-dependent protease